MTPGPVSSDTLTWLDGVHTAALPLPDRGLDFGDGLFETLLLRQGRPLYLPLHLDRLHQGMQRLVFPPCLDRVQEHVEHAVDQVRKQNWHWGVLRVTVSRGSGPRGYAPPQPAKPRIILRAERLARDCDDLLPPAELTLAGTRWASQPALAGLKHLNRLEQVLAAGECQAAGSDEALMLDQAGQALSVSAGNLFAVQDGELVTPPIRDSGIAGTRRRLVIEQWAPALGLPVREQSMELAQVETADELFYSNSLVGLRPVASLGGVRWRDHPICESLFRQYLGDLQ